MYPSSLSLLKITLDVVSTFILSGYVPLGCMDKSAIDLLCCFKPHQETSAMPLIFPNFTVSFFKKFIYERLRLELYTQFRKKDVQIHLYLEDILFNSTAIK